ncbi:hypothetical protein [Clostridium thermarum]|nr:hypothetical protein [Clostridium thermarum]
MFFQYPEYYTIEFIEEQPENKREKYLIENEADEDYIEQDDEQKQV